jgi:hypothetical protein
LPTTNTTFNMRFAVSTAALAAFITSVLAQTSGFEPIVKPVKGEDVPAGSTYTVEWQHSSTYSGPVTLSLLGGKSPETLEAKGTIGSKLIPGPPEPRNPTRLTTLTSCQRR